MSDDDKKVVSIRQTFGDIDPDRVARQLMRDLAEPKSATLASISAACTRQIDYQRAVGVPQMQVQYELAIYWLRAQRPPRRFARLRWLWQQLRALW